MFSNNQIEIDSLPKVEDLKLKAIDKRYFNIIIFNIIITFSSLIGVFTALRFVIKKAVYNTHVYWFLLVGLILFFLIQFIVYKLGFKMRRYAMREEDIIYTEGLLTNTTTTLPFNRIQHIEIARSFLARKMSLSTLKIYSAGESGGDLSIKGLPKEEAETINAFLTKILNERV